VCIGTGGIGSLEEILISDKKYTQSFKKLSPYFVPNTLVNMAAARVSMRYVS
jgi:3-oxoacyl-(acyl-carrier-protein) synthase